MSQVKSRDEATVKLIRDLYERFQMVDMYVYVLIVVVVASLAHLALRALEFSVRKDLS